MFVDRAVAIFSAEMAKWPFIGGHIKWLVCLEPEPGQVKRCCWWIFGIEADIRSHLLGGVGVEAGREKAFNTTSSILGIEIIAVKLIDKARPVGDGRHMRKKISVWWDCSSFFYFCCRICRRQAVSEIPAGFVKVFLRISWNWEDMERVKVRFYCGSN